MQCLTQPFCDVVWRHTSRLVICLPKVILCSLQVHDGIAPVLDRVATTIYNHSPVWAQNRACTLYGGRLNRVRYGEEFVRWSQFYADSGAWSAAKVVEYQRQQVVELVRHCFDTVPYYREHWQGLRVSPADIRGPEDLPKLPFTDKENVFRHGNRMLSDLYDHRALVTGMTGGSTGMPLVRHFTAGELQRHYAIFWARMRPGVRRGERYAAFQGKEIVHQTQRRPPYWRENYAANQRLYSMRHLSPGKLKDYAQSMIDEAFVYYQGYVSILAVVAEYMQNSGMRLRQPPRAVFTTSEQLTRATRKLLETAWQTRVWDEYCQGERCALIRQCEYGNYHPQMDYGVVEYEPIAPEGDNLLAEIICTGFIPRAAPLVRYRVGDRVLLGRGTECPCGALGPVIKAIRGRTGDCILTPDGRRYPHISLIVDLLRNVRRTQVVQERRDEITVRVVPFPQFSKEDERHVERCFRERIGADIGVRVTKVDELERMPNGKILSIINRLPDHANLRSCSED